jgi:hypothetical protein
MTALDRPVSIDTGQTLRVAKLRVRPIGQLSEGCFVYAQASESEPIDLESVTGTQLDEMTRALIGEGQIGVPNVGIGEHVKQHTPYMEGRPRHIRIVVESILIQDTPLAERGDVTDVLAE